MDIKTKVENTKVRLSELAHKSDTSPTLQIEVLYKIHTLDHLLNMSNFSKCDVEIVKELDVIWKEYLSDVPTTKC